MGQIESLEIQLSKENSSQTPRLRINTDQQSTSSPAVSMNKFNIEEVVKAHPEAKTRKYKKKIKKQEKYIDYLSKLL